MAKDFTFKQFHINAFDCGMPVSTDGILLGAWADIQESRHILDIGSGSGLLSIMCAQRNAIAEITGVEIESNAFQATSKNYNKSPWKQRLHSIHIDIKDFVEQSITEGTRFESIICNPPYFNDGEQAHDKQRAIARHTSTLSHSDLLKYCELLLEDNGKAHLVLPKKEGEAFIKLLSEPRYNNQLKLMRLTDVKTTFNKPVSRILIELIKQKAQPEIKREQIIIHNEDTYSAEFIRLTKDFYLKM